jgi:hypothetical protein
MRYRVNAFNYLNRCLTTDVRSDSNIQSFYGGTHNMIIFRNPGATYRRGLEGAYV